LPHVGNIEKTGVAAAVKMLVKYAVAVLHRHLITGKTHHFGTQLKMKIVKRRLF